MNTSFVVFGTERVDELVLIDLIVCSKTISTGTGSNSSTPQLLRKTSTSKTADNADGVSQGSTDELVSCLTMFVAKTFIWILTVSYTIS